VRFAAAWFGGETPSDPNARLGSSVGLYSGELVLDLHKGGPVHPVVGLGLGALDIGRNGTNGWAVAGLGRAGLEYAIALEDADVRVGAGVLGGLVGPADPAAANTRAFVTMTGTFTIGF
jgi:hypothetical protein